MELLSTLQQSGLSENEAVVYQTLLEYGELKASDIIRRSGLKRGNTYNVLHSLVQKNLIREGSKNGVASYQPLNPANLRSLIEREERELTRRDKQLELAMPTLLSEFNKGHHRPSVQVFEGMAGLEKVLNDSLTATEEIYTYLDIETLITEIGDINDRYVAKREKLGLKKRGLIIETPFAREFFKDGYKETVTDTKLIPAGNAPPFETIMQIYNNKISYLTISKSNKIGVIIEDKRIYQMHRYLFETLWNQKT